MMNDAFLEEVRRTADIVRYVSDHVQLRKVGGSWKGLCPFHNEKTPSFNVSADRGRFHCFGCGEGGDVFKFAMLHEKANFPEAIEIVARRFGMQVPERTNEQTPDRKEREQLLAVLEAALEHFVANLWAPPGTKARDYLLGRGFRKETLEKIRAGAAADSWRDLLEALGRKFPTPLLMTAGLVLESQDGGKRPYDRFRARAVFPILNDGGRVVAFGARSLDGSEPKYLNSPENPAYHKSKVLYGLSWAKDAIRREGRAVLMEGYLDVARAIEAGIGEAVATCGTALTAAHARLLRRFTDRAVVNFDQDDAGQKAARKSLDVLLEEGFKVQVVELPDGHDPDTYLKAEGADAYRRRIDDAPGYMDWLIRRAASENDIRTPAGKSAYLNALLPTLARIESPVERAAWLPTIVDAGGLDSMAAREEVRRALAHRASSIAASTEPIPAGHGDAAGAPPADPRGEAADRPHPVRRPGNAGGAGSDRRRGPPAAGRGPDPPRGPAARPRRPAGHPGRAGGRPGRGRPPPALRGRGRGLARKRHHPRRVRQGAEVLAPEVAHGGDPEGLVESQRRGPGGPAGREARVEKKAVDALQRCNDSGRGTSK